MKRVLLAVPFVLFACGGPKTATPPTTAQAEPSDAGEEAASPPPPQEDAGAPATAETQAAAPPPPPPDECTPIAVDFEKRARPKLKECYRDGKKKDPNLEGSVKISVDIRYDGKITSYKIMMKTLPDPVAKCMLEVVKKTPMPESTKCPGKSLTIPLTFPTPP
ncbi:MAG TPA: AgmX/PglI C-terminal domain-containing protein [Labilithrix sp.]|jgi:hypothetical protein